MILAQLEQGLGVLPANLLVVLDSADGVLDLLSLAVPPVAAVLNSLIGVVDTEEDTVGTELIDNILERVGGEVATGGQPDVGLEVYGVVTQRVSHSSSSICGEKKKNPDKTKGLLTVVDVLLAEPLETLLLGNGTLDVLNPVVDAPKVVGDVLAQVAHNDLGLWETIKDTIGDKTQEVQADTVGKGQGRSDQVLALRVQLFVDNIGRRRGVDVKRDIQVLENLPEGVVLGLVIVQVRLAIGTRMLEIAEQRTVEAQLLDTAGELLAGLHGIVHRQAGEGTQLVGLGLDLFGDPVVDLGGAALGGVLVGDALDTGDGQGDDGVADAVLVGLLDANVVDVVDGGHVALTIGLFNVERCLVLRLGLLANHLVGLFKCNLSQHVCGFQGMVVEG